jgi:hypothetical protein
LISRYQDYGHLWLKRVKLLNKPTSVHLRHCKISKHKITRQGLKHFERDGSIARLENVVTFLAQYLTNQLSVQSVVFNYQNRCLHAPDTANNMPLLKHMISYLFRICWLRILHYNADM